MNQSYISKNYLKMNKFQELINKKYGKLILLSVMEIPFKNKNGHNRKKHILTFKCDCGVEKTYNPGRANKIFSGDTISCGCFRKEKWRKAYYSWKKDFSLKEKYS